MRVDLLGLVAAATLMQALGQQADGGFRGSTPRDCDTDWSYRIENGAPETPAVTGCLSITEFPPYNSLGDQEEDPLFEPKDNRTDKTQWCSFKQNKQGSGNAIYDLSGDLDKITSWGYCLQTDLTTAPSTAGTTAPTADTGVTVAPNAGTQSPTSTSSPVTSANTASPVASPTQGTTASPVVSGTSSPTNVLGNMPPSPTSAPETGGLSSGAIAAAVVVPLIVVFALVGGFAYYQYSKGSGAAGAGGAAEEPTKEDVSKDPENGQAPMEELRVD